ncbi:MAG TPA: hypothetical protein VGG34_01310 [Opitutaceae bacterium]|jgi:hypothetical protein
MFLIVDISQNVYHFNGQKVPALRRPSFVHCYQDEAETELLRLQRLHPEGEFVLFTATTQARPTRSDRRVYITEPI